MTEGFIIQTVAYAKVAPNVTAGFGGTRTELNATSRPILGPALTNKGVTAEARAPVALFQPVVWQGTLLVKSVRPLSR